MEITTDNRVVLQLPRAEVGQGISTAVAVAAQARARLVTVAARRWNVRPVTPRASPLEGSFSDFRYARQRDIPSDVDIHIMPANGEPGGAGELGVPGVHEPPGRRGDPAVRHPDG